MAFANQQKLYDIVKSLVSQDYVDCYLALDGSSSISSKDFSLMKQACMKMLELGAPGTHFGAVQFSNSVQPILQLENEKEEIFKAIAATRQMRADTDLHAVFLAVRTLFQDSCRYNYSKKVLILMTDRHASNQVKAHAHALMLLAAEGARIVVIGVGEVSRERLFVLASPGCSFFLRDFQQLSDTFKLTRNPGSFPADYEVEIEFEPRKWPVRFRGIFNVKLTIRNTGCAPIPSGSEVEFPETSQFKRAAHSLTGDLLPQNETSLSFSFVPHPQLEVPSMTGYIPFLVKTPHGNIVPSISGRMETFLYMFCGDAVSHRSKRSVLSGMFHEANILFVGNSGSGKSSFINTLGNAFSPYKDRFDTAASRECHSNGLIRWNLSELCGDWFDAEINLWSYSSDTCTSREFESILLGNAEDVFVTSDYIHFADFPNLDFRALKHGEYSMSSVCFLLNLSTIRNAEEMEHLSELSNMARENGRDPIVVVTHFDQFNDVANTDKLITYVARNFGVLESEVILMENYWIEFEGKCFDKERNAFDVLLRLLKNSDEYYYSLQSF